MRSVCNQCILIITPRLYNIHIASSSGSHVQSMRSVCNHHSKILQHHRMIHRIIIRIEQYNTIASSGSHTRTFTHTYGVCDPFVIINPRFYNIHIASSSGSHIQRMRSVCNHHSEIFQHHRIINDSSSMWETTFARNSHAGLGKPINEETYCLVCMKGR